MDKLYNKFIIVLEGVIYYDRWRKENQRIRRKEKEKY
jgi:hypothetical protein